MSDKLVIWPGDLVASAVYRWFDLLMVPTPPVELHLDAPPRVDGIGVGTHGTSRRHERWLLPHLFSLHVYRYDAEVTIDGTRFEVRPGFVSVVPPGHLMEFSFRGPSEHLYVHFALEPRGEALALQPVIDPGVDAITIRDRVDAATSVTHGVQRSAEIWSVLWRIAALSENSAWREPRSSRAVQAAMAFIESHLSEPLAVPAIAERVQFSASHLDRLFVATTGSTVAGFITARRKSTVGHLLTETSQSMSLVAATAGFHDLQSFNKACRRWWGASPREIRFAGPSGPSVTRHPR